MFSSDHPTIIKQIAEGTRGEELDTLVMLLACQKTVDRMEACRETFLGHGVPSGMKVIFIVGRPGREPALCGDILYLDCPDDYLSLPEKVWCGIRESLLRWDFKWIFKGDDDTFCHLNRIKHYPRSRDYMGRKPEWTPQKKIIPWHVGRDLHHRSADAASLTHKRYDSTGWTRTRGNWASGGTGYFLSRRAAMLVAREPLAHVRHERYEDKFVADVMGSYGIFLYGPHSTLRTIPTLNRRAISFDPLILHGATTLHPLAPDEMRAAYWEMLRSGELGT